MMRELPSYGLCFAVFLLGTSAVIHRPHSVSEWIKEAESQATLMSVMLNLTPVAQFMTQASLAFINEEITLDPKLSGLCEVADKMSLTAIAEMILTKRPPAWLRSCSPGGNFEPNLLPETDIKQLFWLKDELPDLILRVQRRLYKKSDDAVRKAFGDAGELVAMSALAAAGYCPRHVAKISDHFGYDIEVEVNNIIRGYEVKTAVRSTSNKFFLSKNEFDVAVRMGQNWSILQVTLSTDIFANGVVHASSIEQIREISAYQVRKMAPPSSDVFTWIETAQFCPKEDMWQRAVLAPPADFSIPFDASS